MVKFRQQVAMSAWFLLGIEALYGEDSFELLRKNFYDAESILPSIADILEVGQPTALPGYCSSDKQDSLSNAILITTERGGDLYYAFIEDEHFKQKLGDVRTYQDNVQFFTAVLANAAVSKETSLGSQFSMPGLQNDLFLKQYKGRWIMAMGKEEKIKNQKPEELCSFYTNLEEAGLKRGMSSKRYAELLSRKAKNASLPKQGDFLKDQGPRLVLGFCGEKQGALNAPTLGAMMISNTENVLKVYSFGLGVVADQSNRLESFSEHFKMILEASTIEPVHSKRSAGYYDLVRELEKMSGGEMELASMLSQTPEKSFTLVKEMNYELRYKKYGPYIVSETYPLNLDETVRTNRAVVCAFDSRDKIPRLLKGSEKKEVLKK